AASTSTTGPTRRFTGETSPIGCATCGGSSRAGACSRSAAPTGSSSTSRGATTRSAASRSPPEPWRKRARSGCRSRTRTSSTPALAQAIERAGVEVARTAHVGYYRGSRAMLHGMLVLGGKKLGWLYRVLTLGGRTSVPVYLNLYDIVLVAGRKPARPPGTA